MTNSAQENLNSKRLARNIRYRLADMLGSQWSGALDAAMDEMLLDEIEKFGITQIPIGLGGDTPFREGFGKDKDDGACNDEGPMLTSDVDVPWSVDGNPHRKRDKDGTTD